MNAAGALVAVLACCTLTACTTRTIETGAPRTVRTSIGEAPPTAPREGQTVHGYVEGEVLIRFTPDGERAVASLVGKPPARLRVGVPSLDRLNAKYRATQLIPAIGDHGAYVLRLAPDANVYRAVEEYGHDPLVAGVTLNYNYHLPRAEAPDAVRTQVGPLKKNDRPSGPIP
jgi:hypothetical protein